MLKNVCNSYPSALLLDNPKIDINIYGSYRQYNFRVHCDYFLCLLFDQVIARELRTNPKRSSSVKMTVHILDVNDNQPQFENTSYSAQIAENSPTGTTFTRLQVRHLEFMKTTWLFTCKNMVEISVWCSFLTQLM